MIKTLISDFDGTISAVDFYLTIQKLHMTAPDCMRFWDDYIAHKITHFEAMQGIMGTIDKTEDAMGPALDMMKLDPDFAESFEKISMAGWSLAIVSAGAEWYIRQHLNRAGIPMTTTLDEMRPGVAYVAANTGGFISGKPGLHLTLPESSPFFCVETGINKKQATQYFIGVSDSSAFAGDGRPDLQSALLLPPTRRFATGWLADELTSRNEPFVKFTRWNQVASELLR
ncbi:MAG: hypothetical protein PHX74_06465 [Candidatus Sumerlaeales bacterium]|nr:hypothetical protein [Candidatus Sumerlaeales bacterium]